MSNGIAISRRTLIKSGIAATALFTPFVRSAAAQDKRIVCRDAGLGTSFQEIYATPFKEATGIEVVPAVSDAEPVGMIKQMVEMKSYAWDMASGISESSAYKLVVDGEYVEPLNLSAAPVWQEIPDQFKSDPHFVASQVVGSIMAYNTNAKSPSSWKDFWDSEGFKGPRGIRKFPIDTIEQALLADGVALDDLYPCDIDRAFASLDRIKPHVTAWWSSGAQSAQLLQSSEVSYINTWNGRAQGLIDAGLPIAISWNQVLWSGTCFLILKGSPKADLCREFIAFCLSADRQAAYSKATGYGCVNPKAFSLLDPKTAGKLPTYEQNAKSAKPQDFRYWSKNLDPVLDRMNQWLLG